MTASFTRDIYESIMTLREADHEKSNVLNKLEKVISLTKPSKKEKIKNNLIKKACINLQLEHNVLNAFKIAMFSLFPKKSRNLIVCHEQTKIYEEVSVSKIAVRIETKVRWTKMLLSKKKLLPLALAQVKASNTPEDLLNETRNYSLYWSKAITKKYTAVWFNQWRFCENC